MTTNRTLLHHVTGHHHALRPSLSIADSTCAIARGVGSMITTSAPCSAASATSNKTSAPSPANATRPLRVDDRRYPSWPRSCFTGRRSAQRALRLVRPSGDPDAANVRGRRVDRDNPRDSCRITVNLRRSVGHKSCHCARAVGQPKGCRPSDGVHRKLPAPRRRMGWLRAMPGMAAFAGVLIASRRDSTGRMRCESRKPLCTRPPETEDLAGVSVAPCGDYGLTSPQLQSCIPKRGSPRRKNRRRLC